MQIYDIRLPGSRKYFSATADPCTESATNWWSFTQQDESCCDYHHEAKFHRGGYSMFINDEVSSPVERRYRRDTTRTGVFSLSAPSPDSPAFYVGLEDHIVEVGVTENIAQFADPLFEDSNQQGVNGKGKIIGHNVFRRRRPPMNLVLYRYLEASDPRSGPQRYQQVPPWTTHDWRDSPPGWDARWRSSQWHPNAF